MENLLSFRGRLFAANIGEICRNESIGCILVECFRFETEDIKIVYIMSCYSLILLKNIIWIKIFWNRKVVRKFILKNEPTGYFDKMFKYL